MTMAKVMMLAALLILGAAACQKGESQGGSGDIGEEDGSGGESGGFGDIDDGAACGTCAEVFVNGGWPCGGTSSSDAWDALTACGCGACAAECSASLCAATAPNQACGACLGKKCAAQTATCAAD